MIDAYKRGWYGGECLFEGFSSASSKHLVVNGFLGVQETFTKAPDGKLWSMAFLGFTCMNEGFYISTLTSCDDNNSCEYFFRLMCCFLFYFDLCLDTK